MSSEDTRRKGTVELLWLDGPRVREFVLPDNWDRLSRQEREAVWRPVWRSLCGDSVEFRVSIDGEED